jgi:hypothetical protein
MPDNISPIPPHFLVIIPGFMGSNLRDPMTNRRVWIDLPTLLKNPIKIKSAFEGMAQAMTFSEQRLELEPDGVVDDVLFMPPLVKQEQYSRLFEFLSTNLGYTIDPPASRAAGKKAAYTFAYDWRQDNRISARQLGEKISMWEKRHPGAKAWIIAHSNGTLVARWYIEKESGKDHVGRLFLMAGPLSGAPKAMQVLMDGMEVMFRRLVGLVVDVPALTRSLVTTFPAFYQLMPHYPFLRDEHDQPINAFTDLGWLKTDEQRALALDGLKFNNELGKASSVETLCFVGNKQVTTTGGIVHSGSGGAWAHIDWDRTELGDGTVPMTSAVIASAKEILPYQASHGDIYVNADVHEKLKWELCDRYTAGVLAVQQAGNLRVQFDPDRDIYVPGEVIHAVAQVTRVDTGVPVSDVHITARLEWAKALPGMPRFRPDDLPAAEMKSRPARPGVYTVQLTIPNHEGYYHVVGEVALPGRSKPLLLAELILVEKEPVASPQELAPAAAETPPVITDDEIHEVFRGLEEYTEPPVLGFDLEEEVFDPGNVEFGIPFDETPSPDLGAEREVAGQPANGLARQAITPEISEQHGSGQPTIGALKPGTAYVLAFSVDLSATPVSIQLDQARAYEPDEQEIELGVFLYSTDFVIYTHEMQYLRIPKDGASKNKARFDIEPLKVKAGGSTGKIDALFFKDNNFMQGMTLCLNIANSEKNPIASSDIISRLPINGMPVKPRSLTLVIQQSESKADLTMIGPVATQATMEVTPHDLSFQIEKLRAALKQVVFYQDGNGNRVFQQDTHIENEEISRWALKQLAQAGYLLYKNLFFGHNSQLDTIGTKLFELSRGSTLNIQIASNKFRFPWGALYLADEDGYDPDKVEWENFLGFKHIIEQVPFQYKALVTDSRILSRPALNISLNLNQAVDIDFPQFHSVAWQETYWQKVEALAAQQARPLAMTRRYTKSEFNAALRNKATQDQILYFFGHAATSFGNLESDSELVLTDGGITLSDLSLSTAELPNAPLVFLNACHGAELSPIYYGGFMEYFVAKGARGMIGTECEVPIVFATEWARRFFNRFLTGRQTLGEIFLDLRREFYQEDHNPLGLLYSLYCDADTRVAPGLTMNEEIKYEHEI